MKAKNAEMANELLKVELPSGSYGDFISETEPAKGVIELRYLCQMRGYNGWHWLLTLTQPDKRKPATFSELNLVASEDALLAPEWVPWTERLSEFRKQLRAEGKAETDDEADELIQALVVSDDKKSNDSKGDSNHGSVQPPLKTRVRQRRIKHSEQDEDQNPN